jgi:hypothetical protein
MGTLRENRCIFHVCAIFIEFVVDIEVVSDRFCKMNTLYQIH